MARRYDPERRAAHHRRGDPGRRGPRASRGSATAPSPPRPMCRSAPRRTTSPPSTNCWSPRCAGATRASRGRCGRAAHSPIPRSPLADELARLLGEWLAAGRGPARAGVRAVSRRPAPARAAAGGRRVGRRPGRADADRTDPATARALVALMDGISLQVLLTGRDLRPRVHPGDAGQGRGRGGPPAPVRRCGEPRGAGRRTDLRQLRPVRPRGARRLGSVHDRHDCSSHHRRRRRRPRHHRRRRHRPRHLVPRPRARRRARPGRDRAARPPSGPWSCSARARPRPSVRTPAAASRSSPSVRSSPRSTTSRSTRTTPICACTCSATGSSSRTARTWTASSGCSPTSPGPRSARSPSTTWRRSGSTPAPRACTSR